MNIAFIFAGGTGQRMNTSSTPKQFLDLQGKPVIIRTLEIFEHHSDIDAIVVAMLESWIPRFEMLAKRHWVSKLAAVIPGGEDGQASIRNGILEIERRYSPKDVVLIHDGVRPLVAPETISQCIECTKKHGNAITVVPLTETVVHCAANKKESAMKITDIVERSSAFIARAPQCFKVGDIAAAHHKSVKDGLQSAFIDSASLMRHYGHTLHTVQGAPENIKITTPSDYHIANALWRANENRRSFDV